MRVPAGEKNSRRPQPEPLFSHIDSPLLRDTPNPLGSQINEAIRTARAPRPPGGTFLGGPEK